MRLWLIRQDVNNGYDTYDSAVVAAETEDAARRTNPGGWRFWSDEHSHWMHKYPDGRVEKDSDDTWADDIETVSVALLGEAEPNTPAQVICASFNAG